MNFTMNPNAKPFVPSKIRTNISLERLPDFHRNSKTVCQCLCTDFMHMILISVYNDTITVYDETREQLFYLEGNLPLCEVLGYLGYTGDDISLMHYGLFEPQLNETIPHDIINSLVMTMEPTQVALQ